MTVEQVQHIVTVEQRLGQSHIDQTNKHNKPNHYKTTYNTRLNHTMTHRTDKDSITGAVVSSTRWVWPCEHGQVRESTTGEVMDRSGWVRRESKLADQHAISRIPGWTCWAERATQTCLGFVSKHVNNIILPCTFKGRFPSAVSGNIFYSVELNLRPPTPWVCIGA